LRLCFHVDKRAGGRARGRAETSFLKERRKDKKVRKVRKERRKK
jgi:hypothetical protein